MRPLQQQIIDEFSVRPRIDPAAEVERRVQFLADYLTTTGTGGYILGISGGLDSTLAGRLSQLAVERVREGGGTAVFVGMRLPYRIQHDEADAVAAVDFVGADEIVTFNVAAGVDGFESEYLKATGIALTDFTKGNTKARLRMVAQYAVAGDRGLLVIGTDHAAEVIDAIGQVAGDVLDGLSAERVDRARTAFVKGALAGAGEPAYMNLPESHWAWDAETAALYSHDPDKARALLEEAGHADGISLDLAGYSDQSSVQMQEILLHQLAQAGIKARFSTGTIPEMSAAYFARKEHDALLSAWTGRPDPALTYSLLFTEDAYYNAGHAAPPEGYDDALLAARSTEDLDARKKAFAKVQQLAMENALVVPIAFRQDIIATNDKVEGVRSNLLGKPQFKDVSLDK